MIDCFRLNAGNSVVFVLGSDGYFVVVLVQFSSVYLSLNDMRHIICL